MTAITDGLMVVVLGVLGIMLIRQGRRTAQRSERVWGYAFIAMALASVGAGIAHGLGGNFDPAVFDRVWKSTIVLVGVGSFLMLVGTVIAYVPRPWSILLIVLAVPKFIVYAAWVATHKIGFEDYRIVIYDYGSALVIVFACALYAVWRRERAGWWLVSGTVVAAVAAVVQQSGIVFHRYFNYNDAYHLILLPSFYLFYRGTRELRDRI